MTLSKTMLSTTCALGLVTQTRKAVSALAASAFVTPIHSSPIRLVDTDCTLKPNFSLSTLTSFQVGGPAEWFVAPRTVDQLQSSVAWAKAQSMPITMLGAGSNLLISDRGLPGLVIGTRKFRKIDFDELTGRVTVGAGEMLPSLAKRIARMGWKGFEWAVGIPGTVGGSVVMNAGAHTGCMADILESVQVLNPNGTLETLTPDQLAYQYRTSNLQNGGRYVVQATFKLEMGHDPISVLAETNSHLNKRHTTQPYDRPSCGSVFRNPDPYSAGWLIEQVGLKGYRIGGAQVAERHANFILNCGGATASDIFHLIHHVQSTVQRNWELCLEPEVRILGEFQAA
jgi:UDP-N-acetylmuramate dehydrogenase